MSKPDWKDAPEGFEWMAQDLSGRWWFFQYEPYACDESMCWDIYELSHGAVSASCSDENEEWRETLERRP